MKANKNHKRCGIYCIKNIVNNKVYIGKSINIYRRINEHISMLNTKRKDENIHLTNAWHKYGSSSFEYYVVEYLEINEIKVAERELYWIKQFKALDKETGYNLRSDSDSKMIVHSNTSIKISNRLKAEWKAGIRNEHSAKLKASWVNNSKRREQQSQLLSKTLSKYNYELYSLDQVYIKTCDYKELVNLNLKNCIATFFKKNTNYIKFKTYYIKKIKIEDIVQTS